MSTDIRTRPVAVAAPGATAAPAVVAPPAPPAAPASAVAPAVGHAAVLREHLADLAPVLLALDAEAEHLEAWGVELADRLSGGARLLAAGNGGSAAEAQHLTSEFVGRFADDRASFSAISLHAESSAVTAIGNDYGYEQVFARQVRGHGRTGDVLVLLSTSGTSPNLVAAAHAAREIGVTTWALTGTGPNPLTDACDDAIALPGPSSNVQEAQLVAVHSLCLVFDGEIARRGVTGPDRGARS
ncbi:D-sedoheptulose-7-phosphate isomerase [Frigoribacterium salinisoli]